MNALWKDLRYGIRTLVKNPAFTLVAVVTLALGIGVNTAIFSIVNAVLLRQLPYPESERIVHLYWQHQRGRGGDAVPPLHYEFWREHSQSFEAIGTIRGTSFNVAGGSQPERVSGALVPADFFNVLGVRPFMGRFFEPEEDQPGGPRLAILSYGLWQRSFGADPGIVGRTISLSGESYEVVGVFPPDFYRASFEVWVPLQLRVDLSNALHRGGFNYFTLARLKPALSPEQANQDMDRVTKLFHETYPDLLRPETVGMRVERYQDWARGPYRPMLMILLGAVAFVLLIACANVANLLLSRITMRRREIAIRRALGASRLQVLTQLAIENLFLGFLGGLAGLLLAFWILNLMLSLVPLDVPGLKNVALDGQVLAFTLLLSLAVSLLLAVSASVYLGKVNVVDSLKATGLGARSSVSRRRLAHALVVGQVGLSVILLAGTLLLVRTLANLYGVTLGFESEDLTVMEFSLAAKQYESELNVLNFERRLLEEIQALPGVLSVATASNAPLVRGLNTVLSPLDPGREEQSIYTEYRGVSPDYFQTLGIPVVRGRGFLDTDSESAPRVAIINESMARRAWPGEDPLGKRLILCRGCGDFEEPPREVVGIVADVRDVALGRPPEVTVYVPRAQVTGARNTAVGRWFLEALLIRTAGPLDLRNSVSRLLRSVDSEVPVVRIRSMEEVVRNSVVWQPFLGKLLGVFAALGIALSAIGLYGVLNYQIAQRTQEIGIRMALGAGRTNVLKMILKQGLALVFLGIVLGLAGALGLTGYLESLLFGVTPTDPATLAAASVLLVAVALLACWIPARRAAKVDPMVALRYE